MAFQILKTKKIFLLIHFPIGSPKILEKIGDGR